MEKNEQDMNLFDFLLLCWAALKRFFKTIIRWILQTIRLGLQYFWVVLIGVAIGVGVAWVANQERVVIYEGEATVYVTEGMKQAAVNGVKLFFHSNDANRFDRYGMPLKTAKATREVKFYDVIDAKCDSIVDYVDFSRNTEDVDSVRCIVPDRFCIYIKTRGVKDFTPFVNIFKTFLNDCPEVKQADEKAKARMNARLTFLNHEIARLDSFMTTSYSTAAHTYAVQNVGGSNLIVEQDYEAKMRRLVLERDYVQQQIDLAPELINFETPFVVTRKPPIYIYKLGVFFGGILGLLLAMLVKYRKIVFDYLKKKD